MQDVVEDSVQWTLPNGSRLSTTYQADRTAAHDGRMVQLEMVAALRGEMTSRDKLAFGPNVGLKKQLSAAWNSQAVHVSYTRRKNPNYNSRGDT